MSRLRIALCLALAAAQGRAQDQSVFPYRPAQPGSGGPADPRVCVVIRTYWGHAGPQGLLALLQSLQRQSVPE